MYKKLKQYIEESNNIVFFGGAGVSTESGIPDFRSKDGLYNRHDVQFEKYEPEYILSRECLYNNPTVFYEFYQQKMDTRKAEPNITHKVLVKMEQDGKLKAVVTQNIDGFSSKESIPKCKCRGQIRPDVTLYGEHLPNGAVGGAAEAIWNADMLIVGGTSLTVYPAASFISNFHGDHLVVINREEIGVTLNPDTDLMITDSLGNVFREIDKWISL